MAAATSTRERHPSRAMPSLGLAVVLVATLVLAREAVRGEAAAEWDPQPLGGAVTAQHHECGDDDLPEGAIQGHVPTADQESGRAELGYNCGLALVGHETLDFGGRPPSGNANMAWAGRCAYVAGPSGAVAPQSEPAPPEGAGVAVVRVSRGGRAEHVANLRGPGSTATSETLHAVTTPDGRSILVTGQYGNDVASDPKPMDIWDVSHPDCRKFEHEATFHWPDNIHNLTISENGRYVFATQPLQVADISGLWDDDPETGVEYLGNLEEAMEGPTVAAGPLADVDDVLPAAVRRAQHPGNASHEAWPSPDGETLYVGGVTPAFEIFTILDISEWLQRDDEGNPEGPPRIVSQRSGRGHSVRTATIDGEPYVLHSEESVFGAAYGCLPETTNPFAGPAQPWLTSIEDPEDPELVSQFGLEINEPEHCPEQLDSGANQSVHYHDVDDPDDTTFVMASMWNAGLRVFDVRNPEEPTEVAYFNPGDVDPTEDVLLDHAWAHVRWVPETGRIWLSTSVGGFWVLRLEEQVREHLGLEERGAARGRERPDAAPDDPGHAGTTGASLPVPTPPFAEHHPLSSP